MNRSDLSQSCSTDRQPRHEAQPLSQSTVQPAAQAQFAWIPRPLPLSDPDLQPEAAPASAPHASPAASAGVQAGTTSDPKPLPLPSDATAAGAVTAEASGLTGSANAPIAPADNEFPGEVEMTLVEHLEELRWRILRSLVAVVIGAGLCLLFVRPLVRLLEVPAAGVRFLQLAPGEFLRV